MKKDTQAKKWLWGTLLVGAAAVILLIWAGNTILYPTYMHWRGLPTEADKAELYAFAEKLGYEPENEVSQYVQCNGWGSAKGCSIKLYFLETQALDENFFRTRSELELTGEVDLRSTSAAMIVGGHGSRIQISGSSNSLDLSLSDISVDVRGFHIIDRETDMGWGVTVRETRALTQPVRLEGQLIDQNIVSILHPIRCADRWLGICGENFVDHNGRRW